MRRRRRTKILIESNRGLAAKFAKEIATSYEVRTIVEPQYSLTMIKMRETAQQSLFYLGEVLVTECRVQMGDVIGVGVVIGMEEQLAYELAVIDAAYRAALQQTYAWDAQLLEAEKQLHDEQSIREAVIGKTKVRFETMEVE